MEFFVNLTEILIENALEILACSTLNELAIKLNTSQATISNWKSRNSYSAFCSALIENGYISELSSILSVAASSDINHKYFIQPQNQNLQNTMEDALCLFGTEEELFKNLKEFLIEKLLDRLSVIPNQSLAKFLDNLIFIDGEPIQARPFLFLYYIFQIIKSNPKEIENITQYKNYILDRIASFKVFSLNNYPAFTNNIKKSIADLIEAKFSEEECKNFLHNSILVICLLEKRMPNAVVKAHQEYFK